jgi:hypothetical protein
MKTANEFLRSKGYNGKAVTQSRKILENLMNEFVNQSRWISVEERLPEGNDEYGMYLDVLACDGRNRFIAFYNDQLKQWYKGKENIKCKVTHWQPLPPAPNEVQPREEEV